MPSLFRLIWGCDPSIFQLFAPKMTTAPTWKASTLNLQCFDYTTAAQLFHHQLAFHVASVKWGKNVPFSASGITVIENFNYPLKRVGKFPAFVRAYQPNQQTKYFPQTNSSPLQHDDWKTILSFWNGPFMGHLNIHRAWHLFGAAEMSEISRKSSEPNLPRYFDVDFVGE